VATKCYDWAAWDDAWQFLEDGNADFARQNLADVTLIDMNVSAIVFLDNAGHVKLARACDLEARNMIDVPHALLDQLKPGSRLTTFSSPQGVATGLVILPEGPMLVAARPVIRTDHSGAANGVLLFGRLLVGSQVARLTEQLHMPVSLLPYAESMATPGWKEPAVMLAGASDQKTPGTSVRPASDETISGFALLRDVNGRPGTMLRVDLPRTIWQQGQQSVAYAIRSIAGMGIVFALLTLALLDARVLRRLAKLRDELATVGKQGGLAARVTRDGKDEIADVASNVNAMLAELQTLETARRAQDQECRKLALVASRTDNSVVITDALGKIEWVNDGFVRLTGHLPEEATGKSPGELLQGPQTDSSTIALMRSALQRGDGFNVELINYTRSRRAYWASVDVQPVYDDQQKLTNYIAVSKDVTARRDAEAKARQSDEQLRMLVANIPGAVYHYECGATWQVTFLSDAIVAMCGFSVDDFVTVGTRRLHDLIDPRDANRVLLAIEGAALRSEPYELEYRLRRADGSLCWVLDRGRSGHAPDGRLLCLNGVLFDITHRKEAQSPSPIPTAA